MCVCTYGNLSDHHTKILPTATSLLDAAPMLHEHGLESYPALRNAVNYDSRISGSFCIPDHLHDARHSVSSDLYRFAAALCRVETFHGYV